jgi:Mrp family chromosome partitioning ATPase
MSAAMITVLSLPQLLERQPATPPASWIERGLLPPQGILFVSGEPKVGKSLLVANLALLLAAGKERAGFAAPVARRVPMRSSSCPRRSL